MQEIPIQAIPAQQVKCVLGGRNTQIYIYQKSPGLFVDVNVNGVDIVTGVIARDALEIVHAHYEGFAGNIYFTDLQGTSDPDYTGLGSRFKLLYVTAAEYAQL